MHSTPARRKHRRLFKIGLVAAALASGVLAVGAAADQISNDLDTTVDAVAETMPLTVGVANGTTRLYIVPQNGDGKQGCNLTGSTTATISLTSSNPSVATVSPSSVTFTSCVTSTTGPVVTVTPGVAGSTTISATLTGNTTAGTFDVAPVTFTVNVAPPPNTPPHVSVSGVTGGASYNKGSVPSATCNVTDAEDGNSSFAATLSAITGPYASDGIGEQTASCSYTDAGGLTASDSVTYNIVDPSAPSIGYTLTPASPNGDNGWYTSDVSLTWSVTESESPSSLVKTGCVDQNVNADQTSTSYSCSATSAGGSAGPVSVSIKRDATKPTISGSASPTANGNGWNKSDVTVSFTCGDNLSGVASCGPDQTLSSEGTNQSVTGTVVDNAGNSDQAAVAGINIDKTLPSASASASPAPNANGWNNTDVTVSFSGSDALSGIDFCASDVVLSSEGAGQSASGTCTDKAGNESTLATASGINIDKTDPDVSLVGGPADGGSYYFGSVPAAPSCSASDALSGLDGSCGVSGYDASVGTHTVTATAKDKADNESSVSHTYSVLAWTLRGFYQPVDMGDVYNTVKNGSTVPLKFEVFAGATELTDVADVKSLSYAQTACDTTATTDDIETTATGGTSLRYDATAGQFVYNWKTPSTPGKCYRVTMTTLDGSLLAAYFKLK